MVHLVSEMFGKKLKNPIILASGILGMTKETLEKVCEFGAGAVTAKTLSLEPREGHHGPNIVETECGIMNAMGYPNPGIKEGLKEFGGWNRKEGLIISITGKNTDEFEELAERIDGSKDLGASAVEAVISCPHTPEYGTMAGQQTPESVTGIVNAIKAKTRLPLIIKLSPSIPGEVAVAKAAEEAGADAINMGNTHGPGMKIDIHRKTPAIGFGRGGLSGPAIKPITIRCIYDIYKAVKIPILGTGGVNNGVDAIEMLMAGAKWIGLGTAVYYRGPTVFGKINREISAWMKLNGYESLDKIVGVAHE